MTRANDNARCEAGCHMKREVPAPAMPPHTAFATASLGAAVVRPSGPVVQPPAAVGSGAHANTANNPPAPVATPAGTPAQASGAVSPPQSGSTGGVCEGPNSNCIGDVTHWDGGLGACGWDVTTASELQIAMPVGLMGAKSNGNPYCGRAVTIKNPKTGLTVVAKVGDKCMVRFPECECD